MSQSLYEKYGGFKTVSRIVIAFYEQVLDSDLVGHHFEDVDLHRLVDHQTKFISSILGGPVAFGDERLEAVHRNLKITHADFDEIENLLEQSLQRHGMEDNDIRETLSVIESKRNIIVARPAA